MFRKPPRWINPHRKFFNLLSNNSVEFKEKRLYYGYKPEQLYSVVADVNGYERFLPHVLHSKIVSQDANHAKAVLKVGFQLPPGFEMIVTDGQISEQYNSEIKTIPCREIHVNGQGELFEYLDNEWKFIDHEEGSVVEFLVRFQFKNPLYQHVSSHVLDTIVSSMTNSFEREYENRFGKPIHPPEILK